MKLAPSRLLALGAAAAALSFSPASDVSAAESCEPRNIQLDGPCPAQDPYFICFNTFKACGLPTDGECGEYGSGSTGWHEIWCYWNW